MFKSIGQATGMPRDPPHTCPHQLTRARVSCVAFL
jgi:hypothetical protein